MMTDNKDALSALRTIYAAMVEDFGEPDGTDDGSVAAGETMAITFKMMREMSEAIKILTATSAGVDVSRVREALTAARNAMNDYINGEHFNKDTGKNDTYFSHPITLCDEALTSIPDMREAWLPIESAPRDGTVIRVKIDSMSFLAKWKDGFLDENEKECGCWVAHDEDLHPSCWTDGICWASNENGDCSYHPAHWQPLPAAPKGGKL